MKENITTEYLDLNIIIRLNVNVQNIPLKRQFVRMTICSLQETHFTYNDVERLKVKEWIL